MAVAPALVVDLGAAYTKIGFAGNLDPCLSYATAIGGPVVRKFDGTGADADAADADAAGPLPPSWCSASAQRSLADQLISVLGVDPSDGSAVSALVVVESSDRYVLGGAGGQQQQQQQGALPPPPTAANNNDDDAAADLAEAAFEALGVQALRVEPAAPCALLGFQLLAASAERRGRPEPSGGGVIGGGAGAKAAAAAAAAARLDDLAASVAAATATGLVVDAGAESTRVMPVVDGYALAAAAVELPPVAAMAADAARQRQGRFGAVAAEEQNDDEADDVVAAVVAEAVDAAVCCAPVDARRALLGGIVLTGGGAAAAGRHGPPPLSRRAVEASVAKAARARMGPGAKPLEACAVRDPSRWGHAAWAGASALAALWSSPGGAAAAATAAAAAGRGSSWGGGALGGCGSGSAASLEQVCVTRQAYEELGAWRAGAQARAAAAVLQGLPMLF